MGKLGEAIRKRRRQKKMTQAVLAKKLGCTEGYIAHLEHGRSLPSELKLLHLCDILEMDKREMIGFRQREKASDQAKPFYEKETTIEMYYRDGKTMTKEQFDYAVKVIRAIEKNDKIKTAIDLLIGEE